MGGAIETCRGYVNTWECDENDHLNVQFYMARKSDADAHFRAAIGLAPFSYREDQSNVEIVEDHIRYVGELRAADSLIIRSSVFELGETTARVFHEMRNGVTDSLSATFVSTWEKRDQHKSLDPWTDSERKLLERHYAALPDVAQKRSAGLEPAPTTITLDRAADLLIPIYKGVVLPAHCDKAGLMKPQFYVARFSDGGAHLWHKMGLDWATLQTQQQGSVVIESCISYVEPLQADDLVTLCSQVRGVDNKTIRFRHFVFNGATGALAVTADMTAIIMDLDARRAIEVPAKNRAVIEALIVELSP